MVDARFAAWWQALPPAWKEALHAALAGGVAECELLHSDRSPALYVFFVPPDDAPSVRRSLLGQRRVAEGQT